MSSTDLLAEFRASRSESAFGALAQRYTHFVYSIAKRRLSNSALAEEVTQTVFTRLAQAPPPLRQDAELTAWLHRTAVHVSIDVWRSESRRRLREQHAIAMQTSPSPDDTLWDQLAPVLDQALDQLRAPERQVLLLRFFERKPMRAVGQALGVSEDAAKMRVSRALDRLRGLLSAQGIVCGTVALSAVLLERSVEAAPPGLMSQTAAIGQLAASAAAPLSSILPYPALKVAGILGGLAVLTVTVLLLVQSPHRATAPAHDSALRAASASPASSLASAAPSPRTTQFRAAPNAVPEVDRMSLRVIDAETGAPLPAAKIHLSYFYAGGRGEAHDSFTDQTGTTSLPEPLEADSKGANVFVVAEQHVPKVFRLEEQDPRREYVLRLDSARTISGKVVDPEGQPVQGLTIRLQPAHTSTGGAEHPDFQLSSAKSDSNGRWQFSYIPKNYTEARLILTKDGFAVTIADAPLSQASLTNFVLVVDRGFTVSGQVVDARGQGVPNAKIQELNNTGYRRQSTLSDASGQFTITGTGTYDSLTSTESEISPDGVITARGLRHSGPAHVDLTIEAEGFAAQAATVQLTAPTNTLRIQLAPGCIFRGIVLDNEGNPIPNAVVRTDADNQGLVKFRWSTRTDADGRFLWNSAPAEPTLYWFEAEGFQVQRDVPLVADGTEHKIQMLK